MHREHASEHRPTVASVSCNGDAESRTIELILHNIIHKYHVVSSVHESRNLLSKLLTAYCLVFFFLPRSDYLPARSAIDAQPFKCPKRQKMSLILLDAPTPG